MPKAGYRKRKAAPGSQEEREILLRRVGFTREKKAILLAAALDAVAAGLGLPRLTDLVPGDAALPPLDARLRAASMAFGVLGTKPSRTASPGAADDATPTPGPADPDWLVPPAPAAPVAAGPVGVLDPSVPWGEEAAEAGF